MPRPTTDANGLPVPVIHHPGGLADAADASRPLARIWLTIAHLLDGDFAALHSSGRLVWMPAHTSLASVAEVRLSNGQRLSCIDWRANRLVDALAKGAAFRGPAPAARVQVLGAAEKAVRHAAMLLGRMTHAANNVRTVSMGPDGKPIVHIRRDASQAEQRGGGRERPQSSQPATPPPPSSTSVPSRECIGPSPIPPPLVRAGTGRCRGYSREGAALARRVGEIGATLRPPEGQPTAQERLQAVRDRVRARAAS